MTQEKSDLMNQLFEIEERIAELWEVHPDNPVAMDVVNEFEEAQRAAATIEAYLETLWSPDDDDDLI
tara:strand:- start:299 stop:499 length:201 start_codon:yes stop_codon:yes gene_type:complete